jgi:hypothetical protein
VGRDRPARPGRSIVPQDPESRRLLIVMPSPAACRRGSPPGRRPQHGLSAAGVSGSIRLTTSRATHRRLDRTLHASPCLASPPLERAPGALALTAQGDREGCLRRSTLGRCGDRSAAVTRHDWPPT